MNIMKKYHKIISSVVALSLSASMLTASALSASALDNWSTIRTNITSVMLAPGSNATELNFCWYSLENGVPSVQIVKKGESFDNAPTFDGTAEKAYKDIDLGTQYYSNKVTVKGLENNTNYEYRYRVDDGEWSEPEDYRNADTTDGFKFIAVGDPQIGIGVGGSEADTQRWINTLNLATEKAGDAAFIYSMGDQIDGNMEYDQYAGFMYPQTLRNYSIATTAGNHDCDVPNMQWHFNNPNVTDYGVTSATGDYYFSYGDTLFINLNSNAVLKSSKSSAVIAKEHRKCIEEAIATNPYAKWRVVSFHQDIYGYPDHYTDPEVAECREQLYPILDDYDIDVVLTGHGHNYTRSFQMYGNEYVSNSEEYKSNDVTVNNPDGTVYFELSTAASKNYENNKAGYDAHIAKSFAVNGVQSYSVVSVTDGKLSVETYRTDTNERYDSYTITKSDSAKLEKSIVAGEKIIASGEYSEAKLENLKEAVEEGNAVLYTDKETMYDVAVKIDNAIFALRPLVYGDVNDDGEVAINDVTYIRLQLAGKLELTDSQLARADANGDGKLDVTDATLVQMYLVKAIDKLGQ